MPNLDDVMFILGEQNGQLDNLVKLVEGIKEDAKDQTKERDKIEKKIDNHVQIDHKTKISYMNWLSTLRRHSLHLLGMAVFFILLMLVPEEQRNQALALLDDIKGIFI